MSSIRKYDTKIKELEETLIDDYNNGRHLKSKIEKKLKSCGKCPDKLKQELKQIHTNSDSTLD